MREMRTRSKTRKQSKEKAEDDTLNVTVGAVCTTDNRKKSRVKKIKIPKSATFDDVLEMLSKEFDVTDATQLRCGQLK